MGKTIMKNYRPLSLLTGGTKHFTRLHEKHLWRGVRNIMQIPT
jgi:hypothetical protein